MNFKVVLIFLLVTLSFSAYSENYVLTVDGKKYELGLGEKSELEIGGKNVSVVLNQKSILTYQSDTFSFEHPKQFIPSKSDLGSGLFQTIIMTPLGATVLVQEYTNMNPVGIVDLMINQITKEEREYGYKITEEEAKVRLKDGKYLSGKRVYSKYKGTDMERFIGTYGERNNK